MSAVDIEPGFFDGPNGRLFYLRHAPATATPQSRLLLCPPFAEEMNKSRHMYSRLARAAAERGSEVLLVDLSGTGDSAGDIAEASWGAWCQDMVAAMACFQSTAGLSLLGIRLGANLALDVATMLPNVPGRILLWHPVVSGKTFVTQFLRLRVAAEMTSREETPTTAELREMAARDGVVEIAGYLLTDDLLGSIEVQDLSALELPACPLRWMELSGAETPTLSRASQRIIDRWSDRCDDLRAIPVAGTPFWNTAELHFEPAFVDHSLAGLVNDER